MDNDLQRSLLLAVLQQQSAGADAMHAGAAAAAAAQRVDPWLCQLYQMPSGCPAHALQDENLGLDPPNFNNGRAATARRSTLAAALPPKVSSATVVQATAASTATALPSIAAEPQKQVPAVPISSSTDARAAGGIAGAGAVSANKYPAPAPAPAADVPTPAPPPAQPQQQQRLQPQPAAADAAAPAALTGSAAILAKLRSQRASAGSGRSSTSNSMAKRDARVTVLYASQTGTGQEIARSIQAECAAQGMPSEVMSMNELGFDNLRPDKTPLVVFVASSTGKEAGSGARDNCYC